MASANFDTGRFTSASTCMYLQNSVMLAFVFLISSPNSHSCSSLMGPPFMVMAASLSDVMMLKIISSR